MIHQVDKRLSEWASGLLQDVTVSQVPLRDDQEGQGVSLYLLELLDAPVPRGSQRAPLQLSLRYLVTTWAAEPEEAHRLLGALVFAAMENKDMEAEFDPIPAALWTAFGVVPRPAFLLRVPLRQERPAPEVERVRQPLIVRAIRIPHES